MLWKCSSPREHHTYSETWWWQLLASGVCFSSAGTGALVQGGGNSERFQIPVSAETKTFGLLFRKKEFHLSARRKHTSKATKERLHQNEIEVFGVAQPESRPESEGTSVGWSVEGRAQEMPSQSVTFGAVLIVEWAKYCLIKMPHADGLLRKKTECCKKSRRCCDKGLVSGSTYLRNRAVWSFFRVFFFAPL